MLRKIRSELYGRLEEDGFSRMKGTLFCGRLVNDEVLHYIIIENHRSEILGKKAFLIEFGFHSVYGGELTKDILLHNSNNLGTARSMDMHFHDKPVLWEVTYYDSDCIQQSIEEAYLKIKEIDHYIFSQIMDVKNLLEFYKRHRPRYLLCADQFANESLLLIKTADHDDFRNALEDELNRCRQTGELTNRPDMFRKLELSLQGIVDNIITSRDRVYENQELFQSALKHLEERREMNLRSLKKYFS